MEPEPLPDLGRYLAAMDSQRAGQVMGFLDSLTDRERGLIRQAALVGYRIGAGHPRGARVPPDSVVYGYVRSNSTWRTVVTPTPREQALLREISVMAFVRGTIDRYRMDDVSTVEYVIASCQSMKERFPIVSRDLRGLTLRTVEQHPGAHAEPVAVTVATLLNCDRADVETALAELAEDQRITRTPDGFVRIADR